MPEAEVVSTTPPNAAAGASHLGGHVLTIDVENLATVRYFLPGETLATRLADPEAASVHRDTVVSRAEWVLSSNVVPLGPYRLSDASNWVDEVFQERVETSIAPSSPADLGFFVLDPDALQLQLKVSIPRQSRGL